MENTHGSNFDNTTAMNMTELASRQVPTRCRCSFFSMPQCHHRIAMSQSHCSEAKAKAPKQKLIMCLMCLFSEKFGRALNDRTPLPRGVRCAVGLVEAVGDSGGEGGGVGAAEHVFAAVLQGEEKGVG